MITVTIGSKFCHFYTLTSKRNSVYKLSFIHLTRFLIVTLIFSDTVCIWTIIFISSKQRNQAG